MSPTVFRFSRLDSFDVSFFRITKWILGFLGCWPNDLLNRVTKFKILLNLTLLLAAVIGEIRFAWFLRRDPLYALDVICPCLTKMVTWIKLICFLIYRNNLELIVNCLFDHCKSDSRIVKKNFLISKVSYFTNIWCIVLFLNALSTSCLFTLKPLIVWGYNFLINGQGNSWVALPFQVALPYEDMTRVNDKTFYTFIYCFLAYSGTITSFGVSGTDGAFLCFCMYISVCFQCLQEDFKRTFETYASRDLNATNNNDEDFYNELKELIKRQQNIIGIFEKFNRIYKFMVFIHFLFASITLGIILVNILLTSGISKLIYLTYVLAAGNQLFTYCYGAEMVNKNCLKLSEVLYFCNWCGCSKKVRLLILFVLLNSQKGSSFRAPFFSPSLQLFASIIQTSGSYFTILQTIL